MLSALIHKIQSLTRSARRNESDIIVLSTRKIYIVPTRYGCLYAAMVMIMWVGSNNYASNFGFILAYLLAGIGMSIMLQAWRNLYDLEINAGRCDNAFAGEHTALSLRLHNKRSNRRPALQCIFNAQTTAIDLPAASVQNLNCQIATEQRGKLFPNKIKLFTRHPGGLFHVWSVLDTGRSCLVYPRPTHVMVFPSDTDNTELSEATSTQSTAQDNPNDFKGHREFHVGDNMKHIDWKAYARKSTDASPTLLKEFSNEQSSALWLSWDTTQLKDSESILSTLCASVAFYAQQEQPYGLILPNLTIKPNRGEQHQIACMEALALHKAWS